MKILLIDNFDSFTYNLFHILEQYENASVEVKRVDEIRSTEIADYNAVVISPGPGLPSESSFLMDATRLSVNSTKVLGVCLGHQAIAEVYRAKLKNLEKVYHGVSLKTKVMQKDDQLFKGLPSDFMCGRYHSWVIAPDSLPPCLKVLAFDENQNIMAIRHVNLPVWGIQFHPESVLTEYGKELMFNWLSA